MPAFPPLHDDLKPQRVLRELVLYGLVSVAAFGADVAALATLVEVAGWPYIPAAFVAFVGGSLLSYLLCIRLVFDFRRVEDRRAEASLFVALGAIGLAVNLALLAAGVEWLGVHYLVAKTGAAGFTVFLNFALRRLVLFTRIGRRSRLEAGP